MALYPLLGQLLEDYSRTYMGDIFDQNFGMGLFNDDIMLPRSLGTPLSCGYLRPRRNRAGRESGVSSIVTNDKEFIVNLDVQQFKPEELNVKVVDDFIVVDGKHEERSDQHGFVSRQFTRRYKIPENVDKTALVSNLSLDGVLSLKAPKLVLPQGEPREIPITQTNVPAFRNLKEPEKKTGKMEE